MANSMAKVKMQKIISKEFERRKNLITVIVRLLRLLFSGCFRHTQNYLSGLVSKFKFFSFIVVPVCAALFKALELYR